MPWTIFGGPPALAASHDIVLGRRRTEPRGALRAAGCLGGIFGSRDQELISGRFSCRNHAAARGENLRIAHLVQAADRSSGAVERSDTPGGKSLTCRDRWCWMSQGVRSFGIRVNRREDLR